MTGKKLTHLNARGEAHMVDVSPKADSERIAIAEGFISMQPETLALIEKGEAKKGDVLATARIAGIMAAKKTAELIPLCHPIPLTKVSIDITAASDTSIDVMATAGTTGQTGVEMEALIAASTAALTLYDMAKAIDRAMVVSEMCLVEKSGGKSGDFVRTP